MSYIDYSKEENAVSELQRMLRGLMHEETGDAHIAISGIYDAETERAVRSFQSEHGICPTGVTDYETWCALASLSKIGEENREIKPLKIHPHRGDKRFSADVPDDGVALLQLLLDAASVLADGSARVTVNGVYDDATENAVRSWQRACLLPETGEADTELMNFLIDLNDALRRQ